MKTDWNNKCNNNKYFLEIIYFIGFDKTKQKQNKKSVGYSDY